MNLAERLVNVVLSDLSALVKPLGFTKKGSTFQRETEEAIQLISLQRSKSSTKDTAIVTINLGVVSKRAREALGMRRAVRSVWDADWILRIGRLVDPPSDMWWTLKDEDSAADAARRIVEILIARGLPQIEKMSSLDGVHQALQQGMQLSTLTAGLRDYFESRF